MRSYLENRDDFSRKSKMGKNGKAVKALRTAEMDRKQEKIRGRV